MNSSNSCWEWVRTPNSPHEPTEIARPRRAAMFYGPDMVDFKGQVRHLVNRQVAVFTPIPRPLPNEIDQRLTHSGSMGLRAVCQTLALE
jgi:hypothetical protein